MNPNFYADCDIELDRAIDDLKDSMVDVLKLIDNCKKCEESEFGISYMDDIAEIFIIFLKNY